MLLSIAIFSGVLLTLVLAFVEILYQSKVRQLKACCAGGIFYFYTLLLLVGNALAAALASITLNKQLPESWASMFPFIDVAIGIFAFEAILKNTNISFFDKGVFTIQDWIGKARDPAIAAAVKKQSEFDRNLIVESAKTLTALPEDELNAYIATYVKDTSVADIETAAVASGADRKLYKALELALKAPDDTASIIRAHLKKLSSSK
jgi:hypothetical protein